MRPPLKPVLRPVPDTAPILRVQGLRKSFQVGDMRRTVLQDVSFDAAAGEFICILGPSGCGKSTLLKIIAGFLPADRGEVRERGRPVRKPGPDRCVVFQEDGLFPWLTVEENIGFGLKRRVRGRKARKAEVDGFLESVGLSGYGRHLPREISAGMKQRVALARALILKPQLLLMDEPFGALDAQTREEMQDLLLVLWRRFSHTILFVTHDINEAVTLADRILVMGKRSGNIRCEQTVSLERPRMKESGEFHQFYRRMRDQLRET